jgi:hypothetical protein
VVNSSKTTGMKKLDVDDGDKHSPDKTKDKIVKRDLLVKYLRDEKVERGHSPDRMKYY